MYFTSNIEQHNYLDANLLIILIWCMLVYYYKSLYRGGLVKFISSQQIHLKYLIQAVTSNQESPNMATGLDFKCPDSRIFGKDHADWYHEEEKRKVLQDYIGHIIIIAISENPNLSIK